MNFKKFLNLAKYDNESVKYIDIDATSVIVAYIGLFGSGNGCINYRGKDYKNSIPLSLLGVTLQDIEQYINGKSIVPLIRIQRPSIGNFNGITLFSDILSYLYNHQDLYVYTSLSDNSVYKISMFMYICLTLCNIKPDYTDSFFVSVLSLVFNCVSNQKTVSEVMEEVKDFMITNKEGIINSNSAIKELYELSSDQALEIVIVYYDALKNVVVKLKQFFRNSAYLNLSNNFYFIGEREFFYETYNDVFDFDSIEETAGSKIKYGACLDLPLDFKFVLNLLEQSGNKFDINTYKAVVFFFEDNTFTVTLMRPRS